MTDLTSWRTEVWHPLFVHFPIAILLFATVVKVLSLIIKPPNAFFWQRAASLMLYVGVVFAWISLYTGDLADGYVSRNLCDPTILKDHEISAYYLNYLFSAAAVLNLGLQTELIKFLPRLLHLLVALVMVTGTYFLILTGHSGAQVVYEQAGGVNVPSEDCAGF
ncbi:DUF2231 domain-containing protein [Pontibacter locisalis]|uniref:DUF2231 domain-containing protein n=1 Tax=Pontibacter locisalis TaxID=1719035 RepID=A0ABW5INI6_9BACT